MANALIFTGITFLATVIACGTYIDWLDKRKAARWNGQSKKKQNIR